MDSFLYLLLHWGMYLAWQWLSCTCHIVTIDNLLQLALRITREKYAKFEHLPVPSLCTFMVPMSRWCLLRVQTRHTHFTPPCTTSASLVTRAMTSHVTRITLINEGDKTHDRSKAGLLHIAVTHPNKVSVTMTRQNTLMYMGISNPSTSSIIYDIDGMHFSWY